MPLNELPVIRNVGLLLSKMHECGTDFCSIVWLRLHHDSVPVLFCNYVEGFYAYRIDGRSLSAAIRRDVLDMVDVCVYKLKE